jgi:hypothetical protein
MAEYFSIQSMEQVVGARERHKPSPKRSKAKSLPFQPDKPFLNKVQSASILPAIFPFVPLCPRHLGLHGMQFCVVWLAGEWNFGFASVVLLAE